MSLVRVWLILVEYYVAFEVLKVFWSTWFLWFFDRVYNIVFWRKLLEYWNLWYCYFCLGRGLVETIAILFCRKRISNEKKIRSRVHFEGYNNTRRVRCRRATAKGIEFVTNSIARGYAYQRRFRVNSGRSYNKIWREHVILICDSPCCIITPHLYIFIRTSFVFVVYVFHLIRFYQSVS